MAEQDAERTNGHAGCSTGPGAGCIAGLDKDHDVQGPADRACMVGETLETCSVVAEWKNTSRLLVGWGIRERSTRETPNPK